MKLQMLTDHDCKVWCSSKIPGDDASFINDRIKESYKINWMIDNLPATQRTEDRPDGSAAYSVGFFLGGIMESEVDGTLMPHINNHYEIEISYHTTVPDHFRVVGVLVRPFSVQRDAANPCAINGSNPRSLAEDSVNDVTFTYSVSWQYSQIAWATRWDVYSSSSNPQIHWFSIVNSVVIALFLSGMVGVVVLRSLHHDISRYNVDDEDLGEDFGWKLVHGDVFRPPRWKMLLSCLAGTGAQIFCILAAGVFLAAVASSPANRGSLSTIMIVTYILFSGVSGFVSAAIYKMYNGTQLRKNLLVTAFALPG